MPGVVVGDEPGRARSGVDPAEVHAGREGRRRWRRSGRRRRATTPRRRARRPRRAPGRPGGRSRRSTGRAGRWCTRGAATPAPGSPMPGRRRRRRATPRSRSSSWRGVVDVDAARSSGRAGRSGRGNAGGARRSSRHAGPADQQDPDAVAPAPVVERGSATISASSRLSSSASRPHGPGCSTSSQRRTRDAVPMQRLAAGRATRPRQPARPAVSVIGGDGPQDALADQAAHEHQPARAVEQVGEVADGVGLAVEQAASAGSSRRREVELAVGEHQPQPRRRRRSTSSAPPDAGAPATAWRRRGGRAGRAPGAGRRAAGPGAGPRDRRGRPRPRRGRAARASAISSATDSFTAARRGVGVGGVAGRERPAQRRAPRRRGRRVRRSRSWRRAPARRW